MKIKSISPLPPFFLFRSSTQTSLTSPRGGEGVIQKKRRGCSREIPLFFSLFIILPSLFPFWPNQNEKEKPNGNQNISPSFLRFITFFFRTSQRRTWPCTGTRCRKSSPRRSNPRPQRSSPLRRSPSSSTRTSRSRTSRRRRCSSTCSRLFFFFFEGGRRSRREGEKEK